MPKYLFILGRNPELSIAELEGAFGKFKFEQKGNAILAEIKELEQDTIDKLGGTTAIGKVLVSGNDFEKQLENEMLYLGTKNSMNYVLWDFSDEEFGEKVLLYLKKRFRQEKLRAVEKKISGRMKLQSGEGVPYMPNRKLIDEQYFVFGESFGKIIETCDYEELERRDMEKPFRRERLAISPRLAKIMINLSSVKKGETLVDPFCGIGVILEEALIQGINVIGIDKDSEAIEGAKNNLRHFGVDKNNFLLMNSDSTRVQITNANVLVTEPDMGDVLTKSQSKEKAERTISMYENLMSRVLNNMKGKTSGKIVFTAPYIKMVNKKRIGCGIEKIISRTGLKIREGFPIPEFRDNQVVGREIFVLEKS